MTEEKFAAITVSIWRLRQQREKLRAAMEKTGLVIKRQGKWRANPAVAKYVGVNRALRAAVAQLV